MSVPTRRLRTASVSRPRRLKNISRAACVRLTAISTDAIAPRGGTMGDVHRLPRTDDAEREASAWIARMNADDVTADDRTRFEAWLRAQSCNAKAYTELSATWQELVKSGPLVRAVNFGQVMNAASAPPAPRRRWAVAAVSSGIGAIALGAASSSCR